MNTTENNKVMIHFISSYGDLFTDKKGNVLVKESELSGWLLNIKKVDIEELNNYYELNGTGKCEYGDVLDFGYWDKENNYHQPNKDWRLNTFHFQEFTEDEVKEVVEKSFNWIKENRYTKQYKTCGKCCYDVLDEDGDVMEHYCIED